MLYLFPALQDNERTDTDKGVVVVKEEGRVNVNNNNVNDVVVVDDDKIVLDDSDKEEGDHKV